ncbi:MAG TPA: hypothetical protein VG797_08830 [Phycisphaerales bacterium]|nr:hypothetical protein [Phycisphaerales bacterium]
MSEYVKTVAIVGAIGALTAGLLVLPSWLPPAVAEEQPMKTLLSSANELMPIPFDTDSLAKYDITYDDSVSTDVVRTQTVKKIGYGAVETVTIVTTPSGTYSSDALTSPYVKYPGIEVSVKPEVRALEELSDRLGVRGLVPLYGNSFVLLVAPEAV